jgi:hypothetical protein
MWQTFCLLQFRIKCSKSWKTLSLHTFKAAVDQFNIHLNNYFIFFLASVAALSKKQVQYLLKNSWLSDAVLQYFFCKVNDRSLYQAWFFW